MKFAAFFMLAMFGTCNAIIIYGEICTIQPSLLSDEGGEVDVPSLCTNGSIWWNYPRGSLAVTFTQFRPFTVCLTPNIGPLLQAIYQIVDGQKIAVKNPQAEGEQVCMPNYDTTVQVLLDQPSFQTYMTLYDFDIKFQ